MILLVLFLIFSGQNLVSADNGMVVDWLDSPVGKEISFPYHDKETAVPTIEVELPAPNGDKYIVKCNIYEDEDPKVAIYTSNGILMETVILRSLATKKTSKQETACEESRLKSYIVPQSKDMTEDIIIYLWSDKKPKCVKRSYKVKEELIMASIQSGSLPRVPCPETVEEFLKQHPDPKEAGGIVSIGPIGTVNVLDYMTNVATPGVHPTYQEFPTRDSEKKRFRLKCIKHTLRTRDMKTQNLEVTTGMIVHENDENMVLDKFKLTSCDVYNINVNKNYKDQTHYKTVFKALPNYCWTREYSVTGPTYTNHYKMFSVYRRPAQLTECPKKFVGDIDLNTQKPMWKTVYNFVFRQNKPYAFPK